MLLFSKKWSIALFIVLMLSLLLYHYQKRHGTATITIAAPNSEEREKIITSFFEEWDWLMDCPMTEERKKQSPIYDHVNKEIISEGGKTLPYYNKVLRVNEQMAGFIGYHCMSVEGKRVGRIALLHIQKEYRRHGYAEMLVRFALNELFTKEGVESVLLITKDSNIRAQKLYEKLGFTLAKSDFYNKEHHKEMEDDEDYKRVYLLEKDNLR